MEENIKFVGTISPMGDKLIIIIPKEHHKKVEKKTGKQLIVLISEL